MCFRFPKVLKLREPLEPPHSFCRHFKSCGVVIWLSVALHLHFSDGFVNVESNTRSISNPEHLCSLDCYCRVW
eukprot:s26_g36.t1